MIDIKFSKIFKVVDIKDKPVVGRIPNWAKELELKKYDEIEVIIDLSMFYPTGHEIKIMNLENGRYTFILSKAFTNSFAYGNIKIEEK